MYERVRKRIERLERRAAKAPKASHRKYAEVYPPGWTPKTASQKAALESQADILLFGGSAGSLKTETILVDAARESQQGRGTRSTRG